MIDWIGKHIWDYPSYFRENVFFEDFPQQDSTAGSIGIISDDSGLLFKTSAFNVNADGDLLIKGALTTSDLTLQSGGLGKIKIITEELELETQSLFGVGELRLHEQGASGSEYVGFKPPLSLAANCVWTLPSADGTAGQTLSTNGSKVLSWVDNTDTDTNTYLGSTDQTLTADRKIILDGNNLIIENAAGTQVAKIWNTGYFQNKGRLMADGHTTSGAYVKLAEATDNGTSSISLQAPTSLSANVNLVLPNADGTSGQALVTDGGGNLSFSTISGGGSTQKVYFNGGVNLQYAFNRFLPIGSYYVIEQNTDANPEFTTFVAPYDGKLIKTVLRSEEALGNTSLTWYKVGDGTEEPDQGSTVDTKTVDIASAATTYTYTYDADATFSKGDAMSVAIDPTTDPVAAGVSYTIVMEFDEST